MSEKFIKSDSVFRDWRKPTEQDYDKILNYDILNWKIHKFVKDA